MLRDRAFFFDNLMTVFVVDVEFVNIDLTLRYSLLGLGILGILRQIKKEHKRRMCSYFIS